VTDYVVRAAVSDNAPRPAPYRSSAVSLPRWGSPQQKRQT
jgi:hypothetical protein